MKAFLITTLVIVFNACSLNAYREVQTPLAIIPSTENILTVVTDHNIKIWDSNRLN